MKSLFTYFILAYFFSWLLWFPLYSAYWGITGLPTVRFHHGLGSLGPLLASFVATWLYEGRKGLRVLVQRMLYIKPLAYTAIAIAGPCVLALVASGINYFVWGKVIDLSPLLKSAEFPALNFAVFFLYNLLFFGFGEETGWRGFALPRLRERFNPLVSGIILTFFWALWHLPLFLYRPGFSSMDVPGIVGWFFSLLTGSILLTWLYHSSRGSILVCALFHCTIDMVFLTGFADKHMNNYLGMLITLWGIATVIVFRRLFFLRPAAQQGTGSSATSSG